MEKIKQTHTVDCDLRNEGYCICGANQTKPQHTPRPEQGWVHEGDGSPVTPEELQAIWEDQNIKDDAPDRKLLSAAPELLDRLKSAEFFLRQVAGENRGNVSDNALLEADRIAEAIAKAEGRS